MYGSIWWKFDGILKLALTACKLESWKFNGIHFTIMWIFSGILMESNKDIGWYLDMECGAILLSMDTTDVGIVLLPLSISLSSVPGEGGMHVSSCLP